MYEQMELKRLTYQIEQVNLDRERMKSENRFRCIEIVRSFAENADSIISEANKILTFVEGK
jgi:hypothetical protein